MGSNKISHNLLAAQSAGTQFSGKRILSTDSSRNIIFSANPECWRRFLSCALLEQEVLKGAYFHYVVKLP
jgi:hypothetical protein